MFFISWVVVVFVDLDCYIEDLLKVKIVNNVVFNIIFMVNRVWFNLMILNVLLNLLVYVEWILMFGML